MMLNTYLGSTALNTELQYAPSLLRPMPYQGDLLPPPPPPPPPPATNASINAHLLVAQFHPESQPQPQPQAPQVPPPPPPTSIGPGARLEITISVEVFRAADVFAELQEGLFRVLECREAQIRELMEEAREEVRRMGEMERSGEVARESWRWDENVGGTVSGWERR